jgi:hypothetical protein
MPHHEGPPGQPTDWADLMMRTFVRSTEIRPAADLTTRIRDLVAQEPRSTAPRRFMAALWAHSLPGIWRGFLQSAHVALEPGTRSMVLRAQALIIVVAMIGVTGFGGAAALAAAARVVNEIRRPAATEPTEAPKRSQSSELVRPVTDGSPDRPTAAPPRRGGKEEAGHRAALAVSQGNGASVQSPAGTADGGGSALQGPASDREGRAPDGAAEADGSAWSPSDAGSEAPDGPANGRAGAPPKGKAKGQGGTPGSSGTAPRGDRRTARAQGDPPGNPRGGPPGQAGDKQGTGRNGRAKGHTSVSADSDGRSGGNNGKAKDKVEPPGGAQGQPDPPGNAQGQPDPPGNAQGQADTGHPQGEPPGQAGDAAGTPGDGAGQADPGHPHGGPPGPTVPGVVPDAVDGDAKGRADGEGHPHGGPPGHGRDEAQPA